MAANQFNEIVRLLPLETLVSLLESQFLSSLVGALAGAFAGAFAASRIAARIQKLNDLERKIQATNSAITYCFLIANTLFSLKKQHILPMCTKFNQDKIDFENCLINPPPSGVIHFQMDFESITRPAV